MKWVQLAKTLASERLPALDGLRALAVATVILYHLGFDSIPGDLGVSAFFVLSGFLITWLLKQELERTGRISLVQFYSRRALRIVPAYYLFLLLIYVEESLRGFVWDPWLTFSGFLYVVNYYNGFHEHPNTAIAHAWSLSVEQQFYLLWPLLLVWLAKRSARFAVLFMVAIVSSVVLLRSALYFKFGVHHSYIYNAFETRFDSLAIGCLIALISDWLGFRRLAVVLSWSSVSPLITVLVLCYSRIWGSSDYHYSIGFTIDSLLLGVLIIQLLVLNTLATWKWIDHPVMIYLGQISYSLYLYHLLAIGIAYRVWPNPFAGTVVISLAVSVIIASGSYWFVEKPFLKLKKSLTAVKKRNKEMLDSIPHVSA